MSEQTTNGKKSNGLSSYIHCRYLDLDSARRQLEYQKIGIEDTTDIYQEIMEALSIVNHCSKTGKCRDKSKKKDGSCELLNCLLKLNIHVHSEYITIIK